MVVVKEEKEINVILAFFVRPATRNKFPRPEGVEVSEYGVNDDVVCTAAIRQQRASRHVTGGAAPALFLNEVK